MQSANFDLRTASREDIPELCENWRASFGDPDDYLDFFFSRRFVPENTFVAVLNGKVVSQLFLLQVRLHTQDGILNADYLFAACTHPQYRGQGIMRQLLWYANTEETKRGKDAIVLLPGEPELYEYYAKNGYKKAFFRRRLDISREELSLLAHPADVVHDTCAVIDRIMSRRDGLWWDEDAIRYALDEQRLFRGAYTSSEHAFVGMSEDETACLCLPQHFGECASLLLSMSDKPRFSLILPPDVPYGTPEDGGMICKLSDKHVNLRDAFISFAME